MLHRNLNGSRDGYMCGGEWAGASPAGAGTAKRNSARKSLHAAIQAERFATSSVIAVSGDLNPSTLTDLEEHLGRAQHEDYDIILDLSETAYFGLDSVALLVHSAKMMKLQSRRFWLAGVPAHVGRVFRAARMNHYLVSVPSVRDALYRMRKSEDRILAQSVIITYNPSTRDVPLRVEILKDLCRRIVYLSQKMRASQERRRAGSPATP